MVCLTDTVTYVTIALIQYWHTALMVASFNGHAEVVKKLIHANADIDTQAPVSILVQASWSNG